MEYQEMTCKEMACEESVCEKIVCEELLRRVCEKTIEEKHTIPGFVFDIFEYTEGKGMRLKDPEYVKRGYQYLDMMYDVWDWQAGVGMYALLKAGKALRTDRYLSYVREWVEYHRQKGLPENTVNTTAPFLCVLELYKETKEGCYYEMCRKRAEYLMKEAPRTGCGALQHTVIGVDISFKNQVWADTLFVAVLFLAGWGRVTGDRSCEEEAVKQFILHEECLLDQQSGLICHGYNDTDKSCMSAVHWGRANTWFLLAGSMIFKELAEDCAGRQRIQKSLVRHLKAMRGFQEPDGSFHTVLDHPETYPETTAACGFYAALRMALDSGWLEEGWEKTGSLSLEGLKKQIGEDGSVKKASGGTPLMVSVEEYSKIPCVMSYYGQGLMILALCASPAISNSAKY